MKPNSTLYTLLFVGIVSALGPFVTDFYLPSLPALTSYFNTSASMIQLTLTVSMIGLAVGQLFIGPLSDRYGRKVPLLASIMLFIISTIGSLLAINISQFIIYRFLQGIAGAGGVVISKSIATDLYKGKRLVRFFSMLSSVQGLAPICAPVVGGLLLTITDWKGIFFTLLLLGVILFVLGCWFKESKREESSDILSTFKSYIYVIRNGKYMRYVAVQAISMGVMFTYISASPFIFQQHYGLSPVAFSLCFGVNAIGIMGGSFLALRFKSTEKALQFGVVGFLIMSVLVATTLISQLPIEYVETALFLLLIFLGIILPTTTTLSLELERNNSGSASAILGFVTFLIGGICSPLAGLGNMIITSSLLMVVCALAALIIQKYIKNND